MLLDESSGQICLISISWFDVNNRAALDLWSLTKANDRASDDAVSTERTVIYRFFMVDAPYDECRKWITRQVYEDKEQTVPYILVALYRFVVHLSTGFAN